MLMDASSGIASRVNAGRGRLWEIVVTGSCVRNVSMAACLLEVGAPVCVLLFVFLPSLLSAFSGPMDRWVSMAAACATAAKVGRCGGDSCYHGNEGLVERIRAVIEQVVWAVQFRLLSAFGAAFTHFCPLALTRWLVATHQLGCFLSCDHFFFAVVSSILASLTPTTKQSKSLLLL